MTAFNVVRFRVKPGRDQEFIEAHRNMQGPFPGARRLALIKTGDGTYCIVGEWTSFDSIVNARPNMIATLDRIRDMLVDLGGGMGVTDPISGEAIIDMKTKSGRKSASRRKSAKAKKPMKSRRKSSRKKMRRGR